MIIDSSNREELNSLNFSDYIFEGFSYEYNADTLTFSCLDQTENKQYHVSFRQAVLFNMQSCSLWGGGNAIYCIYYQDESHVLTQLRQIKSNNLGKLDKSKLDHEVDYLCISVCLNSGDELVVLCESVEIVCDNTV